MKLIIDVPESTLIMLKESGVNWLDAEYILSAVADGVPFPEREKGEWIRMGEAYVCSRCSTTCACTEMADRWVWHTDDKFCRGCGADMRPEPYKKGGE